MADETVQLGTPMTTKALELAVTAINQSLMSKSSTPLGDAIIRFYTNKDPTSCSREEIEEALRQYGILVSDVATNMQKR